MMESVLVNALTNAANNPGFVTFTVLFGLASYWLFNRGVIVPGAVSELLVKIAKLESAEESCRTRNADLEARILALEAQLLAHVRSTP
jgi:hypothetical protein